jgi:L-ascorbate metabolism protein UlaG (beta-lactamase superfamily)
VTHGHRDHVGDAVSLALKYGASVVAITELATHLAGEGAAVEPLNFGGCLAFPDRHLSVCIVPAAHSSSYGPDRRNAGSAAGFVLSVDGISIYHAGDTTVFGDMRLIASHSPIDIALLPVGGRYTMDPEGAVDAVRLLKPSVVIPMHYADWPSTSLDSDSFVSAVEGIGASPVLLAPGDGLEVDRHGPGLRWAAELQGSDG